MAEGKGTERASVIIISSSLFTTQPVGTGFFHIGNVFIVIGVVEIRRGVGQFFVRFVIRLVSKLELFILGPERFFSLTTRFLRGAITLRRPLGESHQNGRFLRLPGVIVP